VSTEEMVPTVQARPEDFDFAMVEEADGHIPDSKTMGMLLRFEAQRGIELVLSSGYGSWSSVWGDTPADALEPERLGCVGPRRAEWNRSLTLRNGG